MNDSLSRQAECQRAWRANLRLTLILLSIWAFVGLGCGVLFADYLNAWKIGGIPLGFWFAQQGAIIVFVILILVYAIMMNRMDRQHRKTMDSFKDSSMDSSMDSSKNSAGTSNERSESSSESVIEGANS